MRVTSQLLVGLSEVLLVLGLVLELPDEDGLVSGTSDEDLCVFVLLDGVSGDNGGDPSVVSGEVSLESEEDVL